MYSSGWSAQKRLAMSITSAIDARGGYTFATSCTAGRMGSQQKELTVCFDLKQAAVLNKKGRQRLPSMRTVGALSRLP